jgi:hypothetical protein
MSYDNESISESFNVKIINSYNEMSFTKDGGDISNLELVLNNSSLNTQTVYLNVDSSESSLKLMTDYTKNYFNIVVGITQLPIKDLS